VNPPVDDSPKDLNPSQLEELEVTPERPAAELPETKVPPVERLGQLVEVTGAQRLHKHGPSPVATLNRRQVAVFRLALYLYRKYHWKAWASYLWVTFVFTWVPCSSAAVRAASECWKTRPWPFSTHFRDA
jgi:hypothetical protein